MGRLADWQGIGRESHLCSQYSYMVSASCIINHRITLHLYAQPFGLHKNWSKCLIVSFFSLFKPSSSLCILCSGSWKNKEFKPYNFKALGQMPFTGSLHPLLKVSTHSNPLPVGHSASSILHIAQLSKRRTLPQKLAELILCAGEKPVPEDFHRNGL